MLGVVSTFFFYRSYDRNPSYSNLEFIMNFPKKIRFTNIYAFKTFRDILEKERPNCRWSAGTYLWASAFPLHGWTPPSWAFPLTILINDNTLYVESYEGHR